MYDSSLTRINMPTIEELNVSEDNGIMINVWLVMEPQSNLQLIIGCFNRLLNHLIPLSNVKVMALQCKRGLPFEINLYQTHLPFIECALLSHVSNPQFYPIGFAQSSHLLTYIVGPKRRLFFLTLKLIFWEASKVLCVCACKIIIVKLC